MRRLLNNGNLPQNVAKGLEKRGLLPTTLLGMWLWPLGPMTSEATWGRAEVSSKLSNPGVLWLVTGDQRFGGNHLVDHRPIPATSVFPNGVPERDNDGAIEWMNTLLDTLHPTVLGAAPKDKFRVNFDGRYSEPDEVYIDGVVDSYYLYFPLGDGKWAKIVTSTDGMIITATVGDQTLDKGQGIVWEPLGHARIDNRDKAWVASEHFS